jgi:hypothetical protein
MCCNFSAQYHGLLFTRVLPRLSTGAAGRCHRFRRSPSRAVSGAVFALAVSRFRARSTRRALVSQSLHGIRRALTNGGYCLGVCWLAYVRHFSDDASTSTVQVLRIWDAFFLQGIRIFYGIGLALLFRAEETLFHAKTSIEAEEYLRVTERSSIDADELFAHVFKEDLNIPCTSKCSLFRCKRAVL